MTQRNSKDTSIATALWCSCREVVDARELYICRSRRLQAQASVMNNIEYTGCNDWQRLLVDSHVPCLVEMEHL